VPLDPEWKVFLLGSSLGTDPCFKDVDCPLSQITHNPRARWTRRTWKSILGPDVDTSICRVLGDLELNTVLDRFFNLGMNAS
jgi:hypothetical protein